MSHPLDLREVAPDGKGIATLKYVSEAPFGPPYFQLLVNGTVLGNRVFGGVLLWSNDGNKLFAQEWRNTQNAHTCLLCIDARTMHETVLAEARGGFLYPKAYVRGASHMSKHTTVARTRAQQNGVFSLSQRLSKMRPNYFIERTASAMLRMSPASAHAER